MGKDLQFKKGENIGKSRIDPKLFVHKYKKGDKVTLSGDAEIISVECLKNEKGDDIYLYILECPSLGKLNFCVTETDLSKMNKGKPIQLDPNKIDVTI